MEIEKGRVLMVAGEINDLKIIFINVYAPNNSSDRVEVFRKLQSALRNCDNDSCIIMGGDWNCTTNFLLDRNREESYCKEMKGGCKMQITQFNDGSDMTKVRHRSGTTLRW